MIESLSSMLSPVEYQKRAKKLGERLRFNIVVSNVQRDKDKYVAIFFSNPSSEVSSDRTTQEKRCLHALKLGNRCLPLQIR